MTTADGSIPFHDLGAGGPLGLLELEEGRARAVLESGRRQYSGLLIDLLEFTSRAWARRSAGPYLAELERLHGRSLPRGLWFMNHAYEWGCTTKAAADPGGAGPRMLRTLDWPFDGLGRHLVVARHETAVGPYYNVTWPGFLGVTTAMAPGRFAAAVNQAPVRKLGPKSLPYPWIFDWALTRARTFVNSRLAPAQLLRQVFEECRDFDEAHDRLRRTPIALPVFFVLAGTEPDQAVAIERLEEESFTHEGEVVMANHWLSPHLAGKARGRDSLGRRERLCAHRAAPDWNFDWLAPPVLNADTRLAVIANAALGKLWVQGFERDGPATEILKIEQD